MYFIRGPTYSCLFLEGSNLFQQMIVRKLINVNIYSFSYTGDICDLQDDAVVSVVIAVDTELDLA